MKIFATLVLFILLPLNVLSQSITNTLGSSGVFYIKDGSNNFLTLTQSTGQVNILNTLRLEHSTNSTTGVIYLGTDRFIHNYEPQSGSYIGWNTFVGISAGNFSLQGGEFGEGSYNTGIGEESLKSLTYGSGNVAVGDKTLSALTSSSNNVAVGTSSLVVGTGGNNVAVGSHTLFNCTTGNMNTVVGSDAGSDVTSGSNLTLIGYDAEPTSATATNEITLGNSSVSTLRCQETSITALSDARDKKNITDLSLGLEFIAKLKPRQYNWDRREWYDDNKSDGSKMQEEPTAGFIAQELDEVQTTNNAEWLNLVLKNNPDKLEATPGNLLPVMVKAIQQLKEENDMLKAEIEPLISMKEDFARLEQLVTELKANADNVNEVSLTGSN